MKIVYIMGDGRSGSTLLDSILSNLSESISVGECNRFWVRYYEGKTRCGCGEHMQQCTLWSEVHQRLEKRLHNYNPEAFQRQVKEIQLYKNYKQLSNLINSPDWQDFTTVVKEYYSLIAEITGKRIIIDSSKGVSWAYVLQSLDFADVRILHLERKLQAVANSWKKDIRLPEYIEVEEWMPKRSNRQIIKTWLKIKVMAKSINRNGSYLYLSYEELCKRPEFWLQKVAYFVEEKLNVASLIAKPNHAIGGNPMRSNLANEISIERPTKNLTHLNSLERLGFSLIYQLTKII